MVSITLERLWMVSERFSIFRQISQVRTCNNFQFLNHHGASELSIKKAQYQAKIYQDLIKMLSVTLERLWLVCDRIIDFRFFVKFHRSGPAIIFNSWTIMEHVSCPSKKILIKPRFIRTSSKMMSVTLERLWLVSDRIVNFRFLVKFHRSGPAIIFNFWTITEQVSYPSKKLLIKQRYIKTSSRWWVLLWKDYGWLLRDFRFFVKFHRSGPAIIFNFWTITEQVSYPSKKLLIKQLYIKPYQDGEYYSGKIMDRSERFSIFRQISQVRTCNNFEFLNYLGGC